MSVPFSGTYTEAAEHTGIPSNKLSEVASGAAPSRNGWTIKGREIVPSHIQQRENKTYNFLNLETGEQVVASRWEMTDKYGHNPMSWGNMAEGRPKTYRGWTVEDGRVITSGRFANTTNANANKTIYKWENMDSGEVREALLSEMRKEFGSRGFEDVLTGRQSSCEGWKLEGTELADNRGDTELYKLKQAASGETIEARLKDFKARFGKGNFIRVLRGEKDMERGLVRVDHTPTKRQVGMAAKYLDR